MDVPALQDLAQRRKVPHAGKDGKTGETLLKSILTPMFEERALKILTWQGHNILGGGDGQTLHDSAACSAKLASKDKTLKALCSNRDVHISTSIDYVPSLGGWKIAWDFIHFLGFMGMKMDMQFTWRGCDAMLAAPLILDLARLVELAAARGEFGHLDHLDCFFKSPTNATSYDFRHQFRRLTERFA
jgi:myo-inositol-1-phosphate synthase